jgi:hypothetical protein
VTKMSPVRSARIVAVLLTALMIQSAWSGPGFQPPSLASAGNIVYPTNVMTPGIVTLMVENAN